MNTVIKIARELHKSKNLFDWSKHIRSAYGLTCTEIDKGVFQITGTANDWYRQICTINDDEIKRLLKDNTTYYLSIGINSNDLYAQMTATNFDTGIQTFYATAGSNVFFTTDFKSNRYGFIIVTGAVPKYIDFTIYPQISEGTTPTPFKPYKNNYLPRHLLNRRSLIFE